MIESLINYLSPENLSAIHPALPALSGIAGLLLLALVAHLIARFVLLRIINGITQRTVTTWDDALVHNRVFGRTAQVVPALILFTGLPFVPDLAGPLFTLLRNIALAYMVLMATMAVSATLRAAHEVYSQTPLGSERPIKGVVQIAQLGVFILGAILVIAAVMDRSPLILLSGLGAMGAILLLVFKDTILGFVASVQLSSQDMVRVGDWIEMPQYAADGDVIDVALHTVKVQNWDKTITMIPTHALIANSFRNWRGMQQAGGRRIMRNVFLDMTSIRFLTRDEISHFKRFVLLADYMEKKQQELDEYNASLEHATADDVNLRRLTNIGTFRAYLLNYLRNHPKIHKEMTLLVRQQPPGAEGLPMQVYAFCNDTKWENYEGVQADIFDHILAILPKFGLRVYQKPSGHDLQGLGTPGAAAADDV
ncbi:MAG: mechanosensitive ion channel family protein [Woeseia sp.]